MINIIINMIDSCNKQNVDLTSESLPVMHHHKFALWGRCNKLDNWSRLNFCRQLAIISTTVELFTLGKSCKK